MSERYLFFCSSDPTRPSQGDDISVCTMTLNATPPDRHRASSSVSTTVIQKSASAPPYVSGTQCPKGPTRPLELAWRSSHSSSNLVLDESSNEVTEHLMFGGEGHWQFSSLNHAVQSPVYESLACHPSPATCHSERSEESKILDQSRIAIPTTDPSDAGLPTLSAQPFCYDASP